MMSSSMTRRDFVRLGAGAAVAGAAVKTTLLEPAAMAAQMAASDRKIRFVSIGTGIRGCDLLRSARKLPNAVLVGTADLYDMHQKAGIEAWGAEVPTSRDYRALLDRKDVDAVFVATSDHLHRRVVLDALAAGKDVYCEKPMSHSVADGIEMVAAVKAHKRIFQAGSQRVSNVAYKKAAEIYASGRLGEVFYIESQIDRNSISGAWVYPIAPDASPRTIDWDAFQRDAPKRPFDALRFFRWRLFRDYGTGLGGDLYVHQISGIQAITGINTVASRAITSGGLFHYKDGRDFPDLMVTLFDYPGVRVCIRCNQNNDSSGDATIFYGSKGTLTVSGNSLTMTPQDTNPRPEGYSLNGWTAAAKQQYLDEWHRDNPAPPVPLGEVERFSAPRDYDDTADHISNFFRAIETREHVLEDEVFGNNAANACHQANYSYFHHTVANWDAATKTIKG